MAQQADALMDAHKAARMKRSNFSNLKYRVSDPWY